jgi:hypothetical protein
MKAQVVVATLLAFPILSGCYSTLTSTRMPHDPKFTLPEKAGIPIQLTTAEFSLTELPPTEKNPNTSYTINLSYRPDPAQRFLINLDPAWLHEGDLKLILGKQGQLRQTNTATREQLTPQIKAIGTFVAGAITTAAKFAAGADMSDDLNRIFSRVIKKQFKVYIKPEVEEVPQEEDFRAPVRPFQGNLDLQDEPKALIDLLARLNTFQTTEEMVTRFYPRTALEILWLRTAQARAKQETASFQPAYRTAKSLFRAELKPEQEEVDRIDAAVRAGDMKLLSTLHEQFLTKSKGDSNKANAVNALFKIATQMADVNKDVALIDALISTCNLSRRSHCSFGTGRNCSGREASRYEKGRARGVAR